MVQASAIQAETLHRRYFYPHDFGCQPFIITAPAPSICYLEGKCRVSTCSQINCILSASVELAECALCSLIDAVVPAACPDGHCRVSDKVGADRRTAPR